MKGKLVHLSIDFFPSPSPTLQIIAQKRLSHVCTYIYIFVSFDLDFDSWYS